MTGFVRFCAPPIPAARVAWLRHLVYVFVIVDALFITTDPIPHGDVPKALYTGLDVRSILHMPAPNPVYVRVLFVVLMVSAVVAATGRLPRLAGWVCAVAMLDWVSNGFAYSKVDHDHFALMVALFVLPTAGRASVRDVTTGSQAAGWAVRMIQAACVSTYALAAWAKIRSGGWTLRWVDGDTLIWALTRRPNGIAPWLVQHPGVCRAMQWIVFFAELCSPVMMWLRGRWLLAYVLFWLGFHLSTYYLLGIHFLPLVVCLAAFAPLERIGPWWWARRARGDSEVRPAADRTAPHPAA